MKTKLYVPRSGVHEFLAALLGGHSCYAEYRGENPFTLKIDTDLAEGREVVITQEGDPPVLHAIVPVRTVMHSTTAVLSFNYTMSDDAREMIATIGFPSLRPKRFAAARADGVLELQLDDGTEEFKRRFA